MNIDITRLKSGLDEYALIDLNSKISKENLENTSLLDLNDLNINGYINQVFDKFHINVKISGVMVLPCSVSLKPTNYPFNIEIDEDLDEKLQENLKNTENTIDIFPIIWENILMEIPLKVVNEDLSDVVTEGNGWKFITSEEEKTNKAFEDLKELLKKEV